MSNPFRAIAIGFAPDFDLNDLLFCLKQIVFPDDGLRAAELLQKNLADYLGRKYIRLSESGRNAQYLLLKAMGIGSGDEVIVQAFTCVAVANSVLWTGAKPVYCDIDDTYNLDPEKLSKLISPKTRAVIIQHTFGTPAKISEIKKICDAKNIPLIEDCAHGIGGEYRGKKLGTFGLAAFFSFGRDKVISGVWGGAIATDSQELSEKIAVLSSGLPQRSRLWTVNKLLYPALVWLAVNSYSLLNIGKALHWLLRRTGVMSTVLTAGEKEGNKPDRFFGPVPGPLLALTVRQLRNLPGFLRHRKELAGFYARELGLAIDNDSSYLRFTVRANNPAGLRRKAARENIFLGDWYDSVVAPKGVNLTKVGYQSGSCPEAEKATGEVVNLPTNPNLDLSEAQKVAEIVKQWK